MLACLDMRVFVKYFGLLKETSQYESFKMKTLIFKQIRNLSKKHFSKSKGAWF